MRKFEQTVSRISGILAGLILILALPLGGCAVAPTTPREAQSKTTLSIPAETAKTLLEKIQKDHPEYTIRALLKPEGSGTEVHLTVYTSQTVHMVVQGFQEPERGKKLYPDCNRWFDLTRSYDPACGGGPYLGTANLVFADGMTLGLLFDLFQAARYPFTYTQATLPDKKATASVLATLKAAEKSARSKTPPLLAGLSPSR